MRSKSAKRMVGKWINVPKRQDFRFWHIATFRGDAAIQSLSERSGTFSEPHSQNRIYDGVDAPDGIDVPKWRC